MLAPDCNPGVTGPECYRVEPLALAVMDTVTRMSFAEAVTILDWVKRTGSMRPEDHRQHLPTKVMRRRWETAWNFADPGSDSVGESWSRALIHEFGFAAPDLQVSVLTDKGTYWVDFCWDSGRVIGEFDGAVKYYEERYLRGKDPRQVLHAEKEREDAIRRAGWAVVRWTWEDLRKPARLAAMLRKAGVPQA